MRCAALIVAGVLMGSLLAANDASTTDKARAWVDAFTAKVRPLDIAVNRAWWDANITGKDEDFGRGDSAYDRYFGDPKVTPNPNLFPVEEAPFYAIPFYPGDLGTNALETLAAGKKRIVDLYGLFSVPGSLRQDFDAGPDLANNGRPHGPLF